MKSFSGTTRNKQFIWVSGQRAARKGKEQDTVYRLPTVRAIASIRFLGLQPYRRARATSSVCSPSAKQTGGPQLTLTLVITIYSIMPTCSSPIDPPAVIRSVIEQMSAVTVADSPSSSYPNGSNNDNEDGNRSIPQRMQPKPCLRQSNLRDAVVRI